MKRYIIVIDPVKATFENSMRDIEKQGVTIEQQMPFLNTLVVTTSKKKAQELPGIIPSIKSIEEEGSVKIQD